MTHAHDELQAVKPTREEQEPANELVTEICDRIYRMQLPVSMPGLGHVNCYALEDNEGFSLVDPPVKRNRGEKTNCPVCAGAVFPIGFVVA